MEDYRAILKRNREKQGLSQNKLAKRLGVTQTFISEIERGRKNPSLEQFFRICKELHSHRFIGILQKEQSHRRKTVSLCH